MTNFEKQRRAKVALAALELAARREVGGKSPRGKWTRRTHYVLTEDAYHRALAAAQALADA